jgi:hypothetical protein
MPGDQRGRAAGGGVVEATVSAGLWSVAHAGIRTGEPPRRFASARPAGLNLHRRKAMLALDRPVEGDLGPVGPPAISAIPIPVDVLLHEAPAFSPKTGDGREQGGRWPSEGNRRHSVYHGRGTCGRELRVDRREVDTHQCPSARAFSTSAIARGAPQERQSIPSRVTRTVSSMRTPIFHHRGSALEFSGM